MAQSGDTVNRRTVPKVGRNENVSLRLRQEAQAVLRRGEGGLNRTAACDQSGFMPPTLCPKSVPNCPKIAGSLSILTIFQTCRICNLHKTLERPANFRNSTLTRRISYTCSDTSYGKSAPCVERFCLLYSCS
jgi:hypothetical protein